MDPTETHQARLPPPAAEAVIGIVAVFGDDASPLPPPHPVRRPIRIGRDPGADLFVDDKKVSRLHAEVAPAEGGVAVADLGSHNGTFVDGRRLEGGPVTAPIGSTVRVGGTLFLVVADAGAARGSRVLDGLVGGPALAEVRRAIGEAARSTDPVLVQGESGTGKESVAELIHRESGRRGDRVVVSCGAIPGDLVEAELCGRAAGAYPGAAAGARIGLLRSADGGTLLLDEVGELPLAAQGPLLRAIDAGEVRPVGEDRAAKIDVRVVATTGRDLAAMVAAGAFRGELLHRLAARRIHLPPLRARREDIPLLARAFLRPEEPALSVEAIEALLRRDFPGNVRELRQAVRAAAERATADGASLIEPAHLPAPVAPSASAAPLEPPPDPDLAVRAEVERALAAHRGNVSRAAAELGLSRMALYKRLRRLGIDPARYRR